MNLQEHIKRILREERKLSSSIIRRLDMLDYEVKKNMKGPLTGSSICIFFKSDIEYFESIMENSIDYMYYKHFSHIDDGSGEWAHTYLDMVDLSLDLFYMCLSYLSREIMLKTQLQIICQYGISLIPVYS